MSDFVQLPSQWLKSLGEEEDDRKRAAREGRQKEVEQEARTQVTEHHCFVKKCPEKFVTRQTSEEMGLVVVKWHLEAKHGYTNFGAATVNFEKTLLPCDLCPQEIYCYYEVGQDGKAVGFFGEHVGNICVYCHYCKSSTKELIFDDAPIVLCYQ